VRYLSGKDNEGVTEMINHRWIAWPSAVILGIACAKGLSIGWFLAALAGSSGLFISGVILGYGHRSDKNA
jgi:hypothetical protein